MSKRSLVESYTALEGHLEQDNARDNHAKHTIAKNDYKNQQYNRAIDFSHIQTYKERMIDREHRRHGSPLPSNEPDAKRRKSEVETKNSRLEMTTKFQTLQGEDQQQHSNKILPSSIQNETQQRRSISGSVVLTDAILDKIIPKGYVIAPTPEGYESNTPSIALYTPPEKSSKTSLINDALPEFSGIPMRKEDVKYFSTLVNTDPSDLTDVVDQRNFRAQELVFKIKNGQPNVRKKAMRSLLSSASEYGPASLFGIILPVMLEPSLDESDRHILMKLVGRLLPQLGTAIKPYTHKVISAVAPSLIDEDFTLRLESREVIANMARISGLANIVTTLRPDLDHSDEFIRNLTSRVLAVVATALGMLKVLPFLKAVIRSQKSWQARHTGIRTVHQICILLGGGNGGSILPYLTQMIDVLRPGLSDELIQVRTATANTIALLAESVQPYGIEAFESILETAWNGLKHHRGRSLASFLRAIGAMIPLMAHNPQYVEYRNYYTLELMQVMAREFSSPDDDMKKSILRILTSMPISKTLFPNSRRTITNPFFQHYWTRRVASDSTQLSRLVVDATSSLASKLEVPEYLERLTPLAKDANENLRRMACDAMNKILFANPDSIVEIDPSFNSVLVDSLLFAFQEQKIPFPVYLNAFGTMSKLLGPRFKPHLQKVLSSTLYRLKSSEPEIRQQSADLMAVISDVIRECSSGDSTMIKRLILFLYESLGEVYPEVLGSIICALYSCIRTLSREELLSLDNPSLNILLPTLTPILKNRQEKVQEECIKLVGLIARGNAESINAKEWMRICFDLLNMLKSQRKRIRIAANATFGDIARTIGPQDVLIMLLNNLNVQERQLRVCTAVAIGVVADTCSPFTILPALMNEYRVPDKNVQNGVLKALSFLFEYLDGSTTKDYLFAIVPLLENALTDRDQVHRQTASTVVRHLALNCYGLCHDDYQKVFIHFLNLIIPNIYETSPHVIMRILESLDALRIVLGAGIFFNYVWAGLFQAARKVRAPYWKIYNTAFVQNSDSIVPFYPRPANSANESLSNLNLNLSLEELDIWM